MKDRSDFESMIPDDLNEKHEAEVSLLLKTVIDEFETKFAEIADLLVISNVYDLGQIGEAYDIARKAETDLY